MGTYAGVASCSVSGVELASMIYVSSGGDDDEET